MKPESSNIRELSNAEVHAAELIASGWPEELIHGWLKTTAPVYRVTVIAELVRDYKLELMTKMNLYRVVCNLEAIRTGAMSAGEYDAAAIAAARLADLLPLVPQP
ncbi:hypothetical protein [Kluyvera georgiana]|uniref:hypothetical protein n=1 Tax=Kluyvera georgiana TaxID=73098 RepID=UPI003AEFB7A1